MKIAIQGHPTRGKEVIQILESLGGKNIEKLEGFYKTFYYINNENEIVDDHKNKFPLTYELYTLEEFEKKFPFKVGDWVLVITNTPYKIVALEYYMGRLSYKLDNGLNYPSNVLKPYKEIKKERNIMLTLDKAKEWYNKGGELKEVALQAYSEEELTKVELPKTWKNFPNVPKLMRYIHHHNIEIGMKLYNMSAEELVDTFDRYMYDDVIWWHWVRWKEFGIEPKMSPRYQEYWDFFKSKGCL